MYTSCRDQAPVEYVRGSLLLSTDGLPQWNPSTVHTQYVVQAPAVSPGPLSCNGVWNGAEVSQPAPPWSSIAQQQHLSCHSKTKEGVYRGTVKDCDVGGGVDLLLRFARASRANLVLHAWRHGIGGIGPKARVGFVAGEFWWLPSFAGGVCQGRLEFVSCLDGHLPSLSLTFSCTFGTYPPRGY